MLQCYLQGIVNNSTRRCVRVGAMRATKENEAAAAVLAKLVERPRGSFSTIPSECIALIVSGLSWRSLVMASGSCRVLPVHCLQKKIWRPLLLQNDRGQQQWQRFDKSCPTNAGLLYYHIFARYAARDILKARHPQFTTRMHHVDDVRTRGGDVADSLRPIADLALSASGGTIVFRRSNVLSVMRFHPDRPKRVCVLTFDAELRDGLLNALAARKQREWKKGLKNKWQSQLLKFKVSGASPATQRPFQLFGSKSLDGDDDASDGGGCAGGSAVDGSADAAPPALGGSAPRDEASVSSESAADDGVVHVVVARGDRRHHRRAVRAQRRRALSGEGATIESSGNANSGNGGRSRSNSVASDGAGGRRSPRGSPRGSPRSTDDEFETGRRSPVPGPRGVGGEVDALAEHVDRRGEETRALPAAEGRVGASGLSHALRRADSAASAAAHTPPLHESVQSALRARIRRNSPPSGGLAVFVAGSTPPVRPFLLKAHPRAARSGAGGGGAGREIGVSSVGVHTLHTGGGSPPGGGSSGSVDMHAVNSLSHSFSDSLSALSLDSGDDSSQGYASEMEGPGRVGDAWVSVSAAAAGGGSLVRSLSFECDGSAFPRPRGGRGGGGGGTGAVGGGRGEDDGDGDGLEAQIAQLSARLKALAGGGGGKAAKKEAKSVRKEIKALAARKKIRKRRKKREGVDLLVRAKAREEDAAAASAASSGAARDAERAVAFAVDEGAASDAAASLRRSALAAAARAAAAAAAEGAAAAAVTSAAEGAAVAAAQHPFVR